ncbi:hypothetical protein J4E86_008047 [Alternaria arbusti]|uniref:uncharacterized protein n=1 Tax=Alternaria arbusti TaxID=232088 RepID=UPI00221E8B8D|nr:uncharacterized protein J4E86_008047 [Alternaria arbusti]KAI4948699.1 hypothetical protein J4E86_008047 [Alternaria arbusti]
MISTIIGFISFTFTLATLLKVTWSNLATFNAAPQEIKNMLSSLKQGLLEERRHLRRVRKRLRNVRRDQSHGPSARSDSEEYYGSGKNGNESRKRSRRGRGSGKRRTMHFDRDMQSMRSSGEEEALSVMRVTIRDLIQKFRDLEYPFLKPEHQSQDSAQWSTQSTSLPSEKSPYAAQYYPHSDDDDSPSARHMRNSNRLGLEYANCDLQHRWLWYGVE